MYENRIDVFVHPENTVPPPKIQGPLVGSNSLDGITPFFQIPKIVVPTYYHETGVTAVCDRHSYDLEKRAALDFWGRRLEVIISNKRTRAKLLRFSAAS